MVISGKICACNSDNAVIHCCSVVICCINKKLVIVREAGIAVGKLRCCVRRWQYPGLLRWKTKLLRWEHLKSFFQWGEIKNTQDDLRRCGIMKESNERKLEEMNPKSRPPGGFPRQCRLIVKTVSVACTIVRREKMIVRVGGGGFCRPVGGVSIIHKGISQVRR